MDTKYTIKDIAKIYNININTLYKKIQQGKIKVLYEVVNGKKIQKIKKSDIEDFIGISTTQEYSQIQNNTITKQEIINTITEIMNTKSTEITKSFEDFALYKLGQMEQKYLFEKEKYENLLQNHTILLDEIKLLPDKEQYKTIQNEVENLKKEKIYIELNLKAEEQQKAELANNITTLQKQKDDIEKKLQEEQEQSKSEIHKLEEELKLANERIAKSEQELDEARRPWWKKLFG